MEELKNAFSRSGFTDGYFKNSLGKNMMSHKNPGNMSDNKFSEQAKKRAEENANIRKIPINISAALQKDEPLSVTVYDANDNYVTVYGTEKAEKANQKALDEEGINILSHIKDDSFVITLEIQGKQLSSEEFAQKINEITISGVSELVFVIGSSCGISPKVSDRANFKLSMSKMTFLHQFARLILIEQIYRAFKILKGEKYHK